MQIFHACIILFSRTSCFYYFTNHNPWMNNVFFGNYYWSSLTRMKVYVFCKKVNTHLDLSRWHHENILMLFVYVCFNLTYFDRVTTGRYRDFYIFKKESINESLFFIQVVSEISQNANAKNMTICSYAFLAKAKQFTIFDWRSSRISKMCTCFWSNWIMKIILNCLSTHQKRKEKSTENNWKR